jgi:hypothetical protein
MMALIQTVQAWLAVVAPQLELVTLLASHHPLHFCALSSGFPIAVKIRNWTNLFEEALQPKYVLTHHL